jgi:hypothetical protein
VLARMPSDGKHTHFSMIVHTGWFPNKLHCRIADAKEKNQSQVPIVNDDE